MFDYLSFFAKEKLIYRNIFLLIVSLIFYAWGGTWYFLLMMSVIIVNYLGALWILKDNKKTKTENENQLKKNKLILILLANLGILFYFKYLISLSALSR